MAYCTNCATEIKDNWNACPNCGKVVNETSSQVNTSNPQNIVQDYSSVDACLEEIKSISNYRTVNSNNKKKAFQISLLLNSIYQVYNYIKWTIIDHWRVSDEFTFDYFLDSRQVQDFLFYDSEFYYIFLSPLAGTSGWYYECKLWCEEGVSGGIDVWIIWTILLYFVISIILGVRSKSIFKGSLLRGNSLINSMENLLNQYPNYPRRGEFIIFKSEFEAATKFRSLIAIIIGVLSFLFIILTIWGNKDNKKY